MYLCLQVIEPQTGKRLKPACVTVFKLYNEYYHQLQRCGDEASDRPSGSDTGGDLQPVISIMRFMMTPIEKKPTVTKGVTRLIEWIAKVPSSSQSYSLLLQLVLLKHAHQCLNYLELAFLPSEDAQHLSYLLMKHLVQAYRGIIRPCLFVHTSRF